MTDKDSNDMTASELLRWSANYTMFYRWGNPWNKLAIAILGLDPEKARAQEVHVTDAFSRLANKIDAELAQALELSLRQGAELWAKANGWPDFKPGEDFGAWLDRCAIPRPRFEDGEPVQFGDSPVGLDGVEKFIFTRSCGGSCQMQDANGNMLTVFPGERVKRRAPEVLGADGLPLDEDDTVYGTGREQHRYTVQVPYSINEVIGQRFCVQCYDHDEGNITWCDPSMLTHTPPDTLERLRDDIAEWRADCANPGSGWDVKTAEWAARIDAIIRRKGGAE